MEEFFDLKTAQDHLKKLERYYGKLQTDPGDVDTAISLFVTAAHLPESVKNVAYKKRLQQHELIIGICDELANRGKHGKSKKTRAVQHTAYDSFVERGLIEGFFESTLQVTLTIRMLR